MKIRIYKYIYLFIVLPKEKQKKMEWCLPRLNFGIIDPIAEISRSSSKVSISSLFFLLNTPCFSLLFSYDLLNIAPFSFSIHLLISMASASGLVYHPPRCCRPRKLAPFRFSRSGFFSIEWNPARAVIRCCAVESGVEGTVLGAAHSKARLPRCCFFLGFFVHFVCFCLSISLHFLCWLLLLLLLWKFWVL